MSGKRRIVPVLVDDPEVRVLYVEGQGHTQVARTVDRVPVPSDDQLTRDLDSLTRMAHAVGGRESQEMAARLRAAFDLDEGNDDEQR